MQLTGKQIVQESILTNYCEEGIQQQGIDVRVARIGMVRKGHIASEDNPIGIIPAHGKTKLPHTQWLDLEHAEHGLLIPPGYYEIEFIEGCNIPNNRVMYFKTRSSVVRCGGEVRSGQFDAGFKTERMGAYLKTELPLVIEYGARLAQVVINESSPVENTYEGQFQGDKQRK